MGHGGVSRLLLTFVGRQAAWLTLLFSNRPKRLFPPVLVGLIRIATNPRIFVHPSPPSCDQFCSRAADDSGI